MSYDDVVLIVCFAIMFVYLCLVSFRFASRVQSGRDEMDEISKAMWRANSASEGTAIVAETVYNLQEIAKKQQAHIATLEAKLKTATEALEYYADTGMWYDVGCDFGQTARQALKDIAT